MHGHGETVYVPFPFDEEDLKAGKIFIYTHTVAQYSIWTYKSPNVIS